MIIQEKLDSVDVFVLKRIIICWGCLLCCAITTLDVFVLLYLMLGVLFIIFSPKQYGILMYFSLVSFTNIVSIAPDYTISLNWILSLALICRCFFKKIKLYKKPTVLFIIFALYMISGLQPGKAGFLTDVKSIINYLLLLIIACTIQKEYYKKLFDFYIVGHILSVVFSFPAMLSPRFGFLLAEDYAETSTFSAYRFAGIDFDANFLALNCAFIIACLLFFLVNYNNANKQTSVIKKTILLYIIMGLLTFSKMFMIVLITILLTYYGSNLSKKYGSMLCILAFLCIFFFVVDTATNGMFFNLLFGRFIETDNNINTFTTGRFNIWLAYIDNWLSSSNYILFGVGMANKRLPLFKMHHNSYIEVLYQFGVVGTSLFIFYLASVAKIFKSGMLKIKVYSRYIGAISLCVCGMSLGLFAFDFFSLQLILCFLMMGDIEWNFV